MKRLVAACALSLLMASPALAKPINIGVTLSRFDHLFLTKIHEAIQEQANTMGDINLRGR
jgi:ABC-type sugar transport system substrate-binding protein